MIKKLLTHLCSLTLLLSASFAMSGSINSPIHTEQVTYTINGQDFTGYYAYSTDQSGKRPGILVVHEWWGHNDYSRKRAEDLAKEGYAAFAVDMYGAGKNTEHPDEATAFMMASFEKAETVPERFDAAYDWLQQQPQVETEKMAAIGYCYGGAVVLGMARAGKDLDAVVSFHGSLGTKTPAVAGQIKAKIAVFTGADDPMVPLEQVQAFEQEMQSANVDYRLKSYPNTVHSFTNPGSTGVGEKTKMPLAYNPTADADSWQGMLDVFDAAFK